MSKNKERHQPSSEEMEHAEESMSELEKVMTDVRYKVLANPEFQGKKVVFIMRGVPGSGKSSIAREIAHPEGVIHSTDQYFYDAKGEYRFDPSKLSEYHDKNYDAFCKSLELEKPVVVIDNTNVQRSHFERYVIAAKARGYLVREIEAPKPDPAMAAKRNIHSVSEETIRQMLAQYEK
ncbi:MAG: ATP-binding protein [bacterium]|nr:ATP-binding protein [bacterium]